MASTITFIAAFGATTLALLFSQPEPTQEWTVLALLAAVVLGIGGKMVMSLDKNTTATNASAVAQQQVAASMTALALELRTMIAQHQATHMELTKTLTGLPEEVANRLRHTS